MRLTLGTHQATGPTKFLQPGVCFACGKPGHYKGDPACPKRNQPSTGFQAQCIFEETQQLFSMCMAEEGIDVNQPTDGHGEHVTDLVEPEEEPQSVEPPASDGEEHQGLHVASEEESDEPNVQYHELYTGLMSLCKDGLSEEEQHVMNNDLLLESTEKTLQYFQQATEPTPKTAHLA